MRTLRHDSQKISVLMVSTYPPDRDGIASYTARLVNALGKRRVSVNVASNKQVWRRNSILYIPCIFRKAKDPKCNCVHVQLSYFMFGNEYFTGIFPLLMIGLRLIRKKIVVTFHDVVPRARVTRGFLKAYTTPRFLAFKRWALVLYTRLVCSLADKVVVHSDLARVILIQDYNARACKTEIIPHGIDELDNHDPIKKSGDAPNRSVVTYFGLVRTGKGLEDLVRSWAMVQGKLKATLLIVGGKHPHLNDSCYERLVGLSNELGLDSSIRFCGYVPSEDLRILFDSTSLFVFPYNEWGDVVASSGALSVVAPYEKPLIVTDVPAFSCLKEENAALFVRRGAVQELAEAILKVLSDEDLKQQLGAGLRRWLACSGWNESARKYRQVYSSCFNG